MDRKRFSYAWRVSLHREGRSLEACYGVKERKGRLTPVQRLRQAELSWLRSGQTTTLFSSLTEKELVSGAARDGGMAASINGRSFPAKQWHVKSWALARTRPIRACAASDNDYNVGESWCGDYGGMVKKL
jgi:hypothetical protein